MVKLSNPQGLADKKKEEQPGGERTGVTTTTNPPAVAKSPTQLPNISMGIAIE